MKKVLTYINLFLGVASLALAGCHSQKVTNKAEETKGPKPREMREPELICMYGVPANLLEQDTTRTGRQDTTVNRRPQTKDPEESGRVMMKYGVPNPPRIDE
ncbi:MAG: hypothetical protein J5621_05090 [Paludibacteraceae bacterium]|nr:hypothetical protein [Paludibacteraceae bacterium]